MFMIDSSAVATMKLIPLPTPTLLVLIHPGALAPKVQDNLGLLAFLLVDLVGVSLVDSHALLLMLDLDQVPQITPRRHPAPVQSRRQSPVCHLLPMRP